MADIADHAIVRRKVFVSGTAWSPSKSQACFNMVFLVNKILRFSSYSFYFFYNLPIITLYLSRFQLDVYFPARSQINKQCVSILECDKNISKS